MFSGWDFTKFEEPSFSVGVEEGVSQIIPIVLWDFEGLVAYALVQFLCVERVKWNEMQPLNELQVNIKYDPEPPVTRWRPWLTRGWKIGMREPGCFHVCVCFSSTSVATMKYRYYFLEEERNCVVLLFVTNTVINNIIVSFCFILTFTSQWLKKKNF